MEPRSDRISRLITGAVLATFAIATIGCVGQANVGESGPPSFLVTLKRGDRLLCGGVVPLSDGGYLVLGRADYLPATGKRITGWLARVNERGALVWEKELEPIDQSSMLAVQIRPLG